MLAPESKQSSSLLRNHCQEIEEASHHLATMEYEATARDTLQSIAVAFDTTTSRLMKLNRMTSSTSIFPGQKLHVPNCETAQSPHYDTDESTSPKSERTFSGEFSFLAPLAPSTSTLRPFQDLVMVMPKPTETSDKDQVDESIFNETNDGKSRNESKSDEQIKNENKNSGLSSDRERFVSSESTESEPFEEGFLKISVHYITDQKDTVEGVILITPTALLFDPSTDDPIVMKEGCDKFGIMCPMHLICSVAMYNDTSQMSAKCDTSLTEGFTDANDNRAKHNKLESFKQMTNSMSDEYLDSSEEQVSENKIEPSTNNEIDSDENSMYKSTLCTALGNENMGPIPGTAKPAPRTGSETQIHQNALSSLNSNSMFLCIRARRRMVRTFSQGEDSLEDETNSSDMRLPEYWFLVPRKRSDSIYAFFLQWSPENNLNHTGESLGFVMVSNNSLSDEHGERTRSHTNSSIEFVDDFFDESFSFEKEWQIISFNEARKTFSALELANADSSLIPELEKSSNYLTDETLLLLCKNLPNRCIGYSWFPVYTTNDHGTSLRTLYRNMAKLEGPVVLIIQDSNDHIFGAHCSNPFHVSDHYYGSGESFLFQLSPEFEVYKWTGENSFFIKGDFDSLTIGGGKGSFGLWLDADLYRGCSHECETYNNKILSSSEDFFIQGLEIWSFKDM